jgi:hypothetical protein
MLDIEIRGAEEFGVLSRRLKEVGDKGLRRELLSGLQRAAKPAKVDVKASFANRLPKRGGLAAEMATSRVSLLSRAGRNPSVKIKATSPHSVGAMDKGRLRHPVFGNKDNWVDQSIEPGVFSEPIEARAPEMRQEMEQVIRRVAAKIEGHP